MHSIPYLLEQRRIGRQFVSYNGLLVSRLGALHGSESLGTGCTALAFCPDDDGRPKLVVGDEASRLQLWEPCYEGVTVTHAFDTGHTGSILCARFLLGSGGSKLVCCSTDRQVRLVDLQRRATRPFVYHRARVKALASVNPDVFLSASEDGTVRLYDIRLVGGTRTGGAGLDPHSLLVEQRCERAGRSSLRIAINSLAVSPLAPHLFVTGGADSFARLYDTRMLRGGSSSGAVQHSTGSAPGGASWVSAFAPQTMCNPGVVGSGGFTTLGRVRHITGVTFAAGGRHLLLSYSGDAIYTMDVKDHAMSSQRLEERLRQNITAAGGGGVGQHPAAGRPQRHTAAAWEFFSPPRRPGIAMTPAAANVGSDDDDDASTLMTSSDSGEDAESHDPQDPGVMGRWEPQGPEPREAGLGVGETGAPAPALQPTQGLLPQQREQRRQQRQQQRLLRRLRLRFHPDALALLQSQQPHPPPPPQEEQAAPTPLQPPSLRQQPHPRQQQEPPPDGGHQESTLLNMAFPGATMTISAGLMSVPEEIAPQQQQREQQHQHHGHDLDREERGGLAGLGDGMATSNGPPVGSGARPQAETGDMPSHLASPARPRQQLAFYRFSLLPEVSAPSTTADIAAGTSSIPAATPGVAVAAAAAGGRQSSAWTPSPEHRQGYHHMHRYAAMGTNPTTSAAAGSVSGYRGEGGVMEPVVADSSGVGFWHDEGNRTGSRGAPRGMLLTGDFSASTPRTAEPVFVPSASSALRRRTRTQGPSAGSGSGSGSGSGVLIDMGGAGLGDRLDTGVTAAAAAAPGLQPSQPSLPQPQLHPYHRQPYQQQGHLERVSQLTEPPLGQQEALQHQQQQQQPQPHLHQQPYQRPPGSASAGFSLLVGSDSPNPPQFVGADAYAAPSPLQLLAAHRRYTQGQVVPEGWAPSPAANDPGPSGGRGLPGTSTAAATEAQPRSASRRRRRLWEPLSDWHPGPYAEDRNRFVGTREVGAVTADNPAPRADTRGAEIDMPPKGKAAASAAGDLTQGSSAGTEGAGGAAGVRQAIKRRRVRTEEGGAGRCSPQAAPLRPHSARLLAEEATREVEMPCPSGLGATRLHVSPELAAVQPVESEDMAAATADRTTTSRNSALAGRVPSRSPVQASSGDVHMLLPVLPSAALQGGGVTGRGPWTMQQQSLDGPEPQLAVPAVAAAAAAGSAGPRVNAGMSLTPAGNMLQQRQQRQRPFWTRMTQDEQQHPEQQQQRLVRGRGQPMLFDSLLQSVQQLEVAAAAATAAAAASTSALALAMAGSTAADPARGLRDPVGNGPSSAGGSGSSLGPVAHPTTPRAVTTDTSIAFPAAVASATMPSRRIGSILTADDRGEGADVNGDGGDGGGGGGGGNNIDNSGGFLRCFDGHKNVMTIKEVAYVGGSGFGPSYVVSGSDDGHVFIWDYDTAEIVRMLHVRDHVIPTCLAVHPSEPFLAACGNGSVVKVWAPGGNSGHPVIEGNMEVEDVVVGGREEIRGDWLRGVVSANRADLQRRQAQAEAEAEAAAAGRGRPVGTGWTTFAAAIRDRVIDRATATDLLAAVTSGLGTTTEAAAAAANDGGGGGAGPLNSPRPSAPLRRRLGDGDAQEGGRNHSDRQSPPTGQVLRLNTALDRQRRRSGSPEETIPAFGLTPPAHDGGDGGSRDTLSIGSDLEEEDAGGGGGGRGAGVGAGDHEGTDMPSTPRMCTIM